MKNSYYDILQVSNRASETIIEAAYKNLKASLKEKAAAGDEDARNHLVFLDEAYSILSSPAKRVAYDHSIAEPTIPQSQSSFREQDNALAVYGEGRSLISRVFLGVLVLSSIFAAYKFSGQYGSQKISEKQLEIQAGRDGGAVQNDAYRAENERMLVQGTMQNQDKLIDKSYDIAAREAERRRVEVEYRANAGNHRLEMDQQRLEMQRQQQQWQQEQYEKDRQAREARVAADAAKRQLCNMYNLNGKTQDARASGC